MKKDLLYLKKLFSRPFRAVRVGGQTNRNYTVEFQGKKFFVRLPWNRGDVVDRTTEGKNILALARSKKLSRILPRYYSYILKKKNILGPKSKGRFDVPDGTMATEFLKGKELTMRMFRKQSCQTSLARMFHTFHSSRVRFKNSYNVFEDEVRKYRKKAMKLPLEKFLDKATISQLLLYEREAEGKLQNLKNGVATHNDFIFQNFLVAPAHQTYLLDFEYAGQNKKGGILYDFGFLFADNLFRKSAITRPLFERFLRVADKIYKKKLDREQIYWSAIAATLVQVWWGILRYFSVSPKEQLYFKEYAQRRIMGIEKLYYGRTRDRKFCISKTSFIIKEG